METAPTLSPPAAPAVAQSTTTTSVTSAPRVPMPPRRPSNPVLRALYWPLAFVCDRHGYPSTSKIMAFAILAAQEHGKPVPTTLAALLLSAAFGYSMFKDFSTRGTWTVAATDAVSVSASYAKTVTANISETVKRVLAGRNVEKGFDPSKPEIDPSGGAE